VKYLLQLGVDTDSGDVGSRCGKVWYDTIGKQGTNFISRKAADLAILKSISQDATEVEHKMVEVFSEEDDFVRDFDFTPIHIAALDMYPVDDLERPGLSQSVNSMLSRQHRRLLTQWLLTRC